MSSTTFKEPPIYYREEPFAKRRFRFCLKPVNVSTSTSKDGRQQGVVNVYANAGRPRTGCIQIESEEVKKIQQHIDFVIKKLQKIHKSVLWNTYIGRSYVEKASYNPSNAEERNVDAIEGRIFDASNGATWSPESLEHVWKTVKAAEIQADGIVSLFCLKSELEYDSDEVAWEIQKVLVYHLIKTDLHRNINEESCMVRQGMDPVSRKVRTPGRAHDGYLVYLTYQLVENVTFSQIMGETMLYSADIRMKKKYLMNSIGDNRFPSNIEEKIKKHIDQVREWISRDHVELIKQFIQVQDPEEIKVVSELLSVIGGANKQKSGVGLSQFISFLSQQTQEQRRIPRSSSRLSLSSVASSTPRKPSVRKASSTSSNISSCSTTPETPRRVSTSSQDSFSSQSSRRNSAIFRRKSQLESIQSDSDSVLSTADTLVENRESSARIRRENANRTKQIKGVQRTHSLNAKQNGPRMNGSLHVPNGGQPPRLSRSYSERKMKDKPSESPLLTVESVEENGDLSLSENTVSSQHSQMSQNDNSEARDDDRLVVASVKLSRQVKRNNSINKSPRNSPRVERNISTPTNRRI